MCVANSPSKSLYNSLSFRSCFPSGGGSLEGRTISGEAAIITSKAFGSVACLVLVLVKKYWRLNTDANIRSLILIADVGGCIDGNDAYRIAKLQWLLPACHGFQVDRTPKYPPTIAFHHSSRYAQLRRGRG